MNSIIFKQEGGVGFITLNRPEKYNSINREMSIALQETLLLCSNDENTRCIVITGAGKGFCAGQDLTDAVNPTPEALGIIVDEQYNKTVRLIRGVEKPVIAAVNGVVAGAGANLALACDIVVACKSASFIQAFSKIGLIPDSGGTFFLPRLIGWQRAAGLMFTGDKVQAPEAAEMGMIYKCYEDEGFEEAYKKLAFTIAQMPTRGLGLTKRLLNMSVVNSIDEQLEAERLIQMEAGATEDFKEGVQAFLEKRKPFFRGI